MKNGNGKHAPSPERGEATVRTSKGLRDVLFEEIDALRSGKSTPARAHAVAKLASSIVETVEVEMAVHRMTGETKPEKAIPAAQELLPPLALGS